MKLLKSILFVFLIGTILSFVGPKKRYLKILVSANSMNTGAKINGYRVLIYRNDTLHGEIIGSKKGKYEIKKLEFDYQYRIVIKDSNYYSRNVIIDLRNIPNTFKSIQELPLNFPLCDKFVVSDSLCIELIDSYENIPVSKAKFEKESNYLEWDTRMVERSRERFDNLYKCLERK